MPGAPARRAPAFAVAVIALGYRIAILLITLYET